ncbi:hypothetical protein RHSIM_Rhsim04G0047800 [Rhododendron simsii]|uniref:Uncharacterized protein n=1 Tax=Rhododendron simsii TaxID=118357 RepID=A0A834H2U3_RHOSS|nr:hypothetical protein RHSIM_Rhsim04G0047800 [Rhododendron simsii]
MFIPNCPLFQSKLSGHPRPSPSAWKPQTVVPITQSPAIILPSWEVAVPYLTSRKVHVDLPRRESGAKGAASLDKGYRSFNESSSNFPQFSGPPAIPGIHIPLQSDDNMWRGIQPDQEISPRQSTGTDSDPEVLAERMAAGAQAGTSTSSGGPPNTSVVGGANEPPRPPRNVDTIPPPPSGLGPMPYSHFYGDGRGGFTKQFRRKYSIPDDVLVERVTADRIPFGEDFIVLPLFTITEDCSAPNNGLLITGRWSNLIALLRCADRDAPTLLDYEPTYAGFAHRKDKSKMAQDLSTSGLPERKEQTDPIPSSQPEQQKQPRARAEKSQSSRRRESGSTAEAEDERAAKKAKAAANVEILSSGPAEEDPANPAPAPFMPDFECSDGHVITAEDSLEENPFLAMTLLKGLALPKDMENLPTGKAQNMAELCLLLAKAGQCASKAFGDMDILLESKRSLRIDIQAKRKEADQLAKQIDSLEAKVAESDGVRQERDRLLLQIKNAEEENNRLRKKKQQMVEELPKLLEDAGDAGYNEAGEYYQQQVQNLVTKAFKEGELKGIKDTHHSSFLRGYQVGLDYAEVPAADHRREPPVVPPLEQLEVVQEEQPKQPTDTQLDSSIPADA